LLAADLVFLESCCFLVVLQREANLVASTNIPGILNLIIAVWWLGYTR